MASNSAADPFAERQQPFPRDEATVEASRCLYCYDAPCMIACPTSINIPGFIKQIATGDDLGAANTILASNAMGASCARVCETDALCEGDCVLGPAGKPIDIGRLQRHATDALIESGGGLPFVPGSDTGHSVGIVGSGPAGLAAAVRLRAAGHAVTIYERAERPGGLARHGIIPLRQPNEIVEWEVGQVTAMGAEIRTGEDIDGPAAAALTDRHDAVLIATGAGRWVHRIDLGPDADGAAGIQDALEFIEWSRTREPADVPVGNEVVIVGGGNTAMDAATIAVKLNAPRVTCAYRRTAEDMTAYPTEVDFCRSEGVAFEFLTQPVRAIVEDGKVTGLECARVEQGEIDDSGRRRPVLSDERFVIPADHVLLATGQRREPSIYEAFGATTLPDGRAQVDDDYATSATRVFACGDSVTTGAQLSVVDAVNQGQEAAAAITAALTTTAVGS